MLRALIIFILVASTHPNSNVEAADLVTIQQSYQNLLETLTPERREFVLRLLKTYAPEIYQAAPVTWKNDKFQMPAYDVPASPFYDGDKNVKNNVENLSGRKIKPEVIGDFSETDTHYFLSVMKYNVKDTALVGGHHHDAENIWMAVRKDGTPNGRLDFLATNRHALPEFYSPDAELHAYLRSEFQKLKAEKKVREKWVDQFSGMDSDALKYDASFTAKHGKGFFPFPAYSSPGKHALSVCDPELWNKGDNPSGIHLICRDGVPADEIDPLDVRRVPYHYSFLLMTDLNENYYLNEDTQKKKDRALIFDEGSLTRAGEKFSNSFGELQTRDGLPTAWAMGNGEKTAAANFDWDLRLITPGSGFIQPHQVLDLMYRDLPEALAKKYKPVGKDYLFNQRLKVLSISPSVLTNSIKNCLTNSWERELHDIMSK
jgi:hypothetical protein